MEQTHFFGMHGPIIHILAFVFGCIGARHLLQRGEGQQMQIRVANGDQPVDGRGAAEKCDWSLETETSCLKLA